MARPIPWDTVGAGFAIDPKGLPASPFIPPSAPTATFAPAPKLAGLATKTAKASAITHELLFGSKLGSQGDEAFASTAVSASVPPASMLASGAFDAPTEASGASM